MRTFKIVLTFALIVSLAGASLALKAAIDPSELTVGGRPLGLGRAYVGLADDINSILQNPAGLTKIYEWQITSTYTNLLQEVDYSLIGAANSLSQEALGLAYLTAAVTGSILTERDPITNRVVPSGAGAIGYNSSVLFLSYGVEPIKYFSYPAFERLSLGANLKIFNQELVGVPGGDIQAAGTDLDIGLQYRPIRWLTLGLAGYNILPYDLGGRLVWGSGITESIPSHAKLGFALKLVGEEGLRQFRSQLLYLAYDYEFSPSRSSRPGLHHLGLEWLPWENIALRVGIDQDAVASGVDQTEVDSNLTAGVGIGFRGIHLDYAYHTFGKLTENTSHFFSISYAIPEPKVFVSPEAIIYLEITAPPKKLITFNDSAEVKGIILRPDKIKRVKVDQEDAVINQGNTFEAVLLLEKYGKKIFDVKAISATNRILESQPLNIVRLVSFNDVNEYHPQRVEIGAEAALGYITGFPDGSFRPEGEITRAELCTLLMRIRASSKTTEAIASPPAPLSSAFVDVPQRHWAAAYIDQAVKEGVVRGYPDGSFKPRNNITRAEALSVVVRYAGYQEPFALTENPFADVPMKHWAAKAVFVARQRGLLDYLTGMNLEPNRKITRGEVVRVLAKVSPVAENLKDLLD